MEKLKLGLVGLGCRGHGILTGLLMDMEDLHFQAVCDVYEDRVSRSQKAVFEKHGYEPAGYTDYHEMFRKEALDAVIVTTAWEAHTEVAIAAMEAGIPIGSEVGCEYSMRSLERLVETQERTGTPYMFLENCCYGKEELLATSMVRKGLLGEIVYASGAYAHDLREEISYGIENRHYRYRNYAHRNLENYPSHELGPIAKVLNINRGNRIVSVVSVASKAAGLSQYIADQDKLKGVPDYMKEAAWKQGDIVDTILTCAGGETISLRLDTTLPRFYNRDFTVRGTKGLYMQNTNLVFLDGVHEEKYFEPIQSFQQFMNNAKDYEAEYLPAIWSDVTPEMEAAGHGGMDYFVYRSFIEAVKNHTPMLIDVYDGAAWMAVSVLSERSIAQGGAPQAMPDFTSGKWTTREPLDVVPLN